MPDFALHARKHTRLLVPVTKQARVYASTTLEPWYVRGHYLMGRTQAAIALRLLRRRGYTVVRKKQDA